MIRCYVWKGVGLGSSGDHTYSACVSNPSWGAAKGFPGYYAPYENGTQIPDSWATTAGSITVISSESEYKSARSNATAVHVGDCTECLEVCPEGSHKCTHNKYPGYCCIPCKKTGDRLKNIANKVGR